MIPEKTHEETIPWKVRMANLIEMLARRCVGCPYEGSMCRQCDASTAKGIIRDRDAEAKAKLFPKHLSPEDRRLKVADGMTGRGWLKPSEIKWPEEVESHLRALDLKVLTKSGIIERMPVDPDNIKIFAYRRIEK